MTGDQPGKDWDVFTYTWSHIPLEYSSIKFHVSLPYWHDPSLEKIKFIHKSSADGLHKITMLFSSDTLLRQFKIALRETVGELRSAGSYILQTPYSSSFGRYLVLFAIHRLMNQHLLKFLTNVHKLARERVSVFCHQESLSS